jgi:lysophospholipase L1-like esterase
MVIGDSLVDYGYSTQQLLTLSSGSSLDITLRGTRETSSNLNRHEGRGGWKISDYYNVASLNGYTNPFRNPSSGLFDFPYYLTQNPAQALTTTTKWVIFSLGINDSFGSTSDAGVLSTFNTSMTKLDYMIASVKISYPTVKIGIVLPSPPAAEQNAFGTVYDAGYSRIRVKRNIGLWSKYLISYFPYSGIATNNTIIIPSNVYLDTKYNFPTTATLVNSYNPLTELRQTDALHPNVYGGKQIGDCTFAVINYFST